VLYLAHCAFAGISSQHVASNCFLRRFKCMQQHPQQGERLLASECLGVGECSHTQVNLPCLALQARVTAFSRSNVATTRLVQPAGEPTWSNGGVGCLPRTRNSAACCMFGCCKQLKQAVHHFGELGRAVARRRALDARRQQECG
jgi:hypothetical protein